MAIVRIKLFSIHENTIFYFSQNRGMKTSTKVLIAFYVLTLIPSLVLGQYVFAGIIATGTGFIFNFDTLGIVGIILFVVNNIFGGILYLRFLRTLKLSKTIFFATLPLSIFYGIGMFFIAGSAIFDGVIFESIRAVLNISAQNIYNMVLWGILLTLIYFVVLFLIYSYVCRPVQKIEQFTRRLGDGRIGEEKIWLGKSKQFQNIEAALEKINYNYLEKEDLAKQTDLEAQKFIPRQFLKFLGKNSITELELGNQVRKKATTMYCDIVGSAKQPSSLSLEENFNFLNSYLNIISPIIRRYGGFVDKYTGEGILAVFSRPESAMDCAVAVHRAIEIKNRSQKHLPNIDERICIHTGEVVIGIMGEEARMSPTIISDDGDITNKLEEIGKFMGTRIIFTKPALNDMPVKYKFAYRLIGSLSTAGQEACCVFECLEVYPRKKRERLVALKNKFEEGVRLYNSADYYNARKCFKEVLSYVSDDKPSYVYFNNACDRLDIS